MPTIAACLDLFLEHRTLRGISSNSLKLYRRWLDLWCDWRTVRSLPTEITAVDVAELRAFFLYLRSEYVPHATNPRRGPAAKPGMAPASIESVWKTLAALWNFLDSERILADDQRAFFRGGRIPRPRVTDQDHAVYTDADLCALLRACEESEKPPTKRDYEQEARDQAILVMLEATGMRVGELCSLHDTGIDLELWQGRVTGKTGQRWVLWDERATDYLARYLDLRSGPPDGPLFRSCWGSQRGIAPLTEAAVRSQIKRIAARAGVDLIPGAPLHGWRATLIQNGLDHGADVLDIQQVVGHTSVRTTQRYAKRSARRLRAPYERVRGRPPRSDANVRADFES